MNDSAMNRTETTKLVMAALMSGLIIVAILILRIPIPFTQGYVNLSDAVIFVGVMVLGKKYGVAAAAIGSAMGDIIGGFAMWAPWTFVIKGGMALIVALIVAFAVKKEVSEKNFRALWMVSMTIAGLFMTFGYFVAEGIMYGNWPAAALGIPWNIGQFVVGLVLASLLVEALKKTSANRFFIYK